MDQTLLVVADLAAISVLTFAVYFPRHHRRDLIAAFLGVNVGVLAVAMTLSSSSVGIGLGMGLFGVLSIIRLRSYEIAQHEIAYYFSALAIGLLAGLPEHVNVLSALLMALIVATMYVGDHPRLYGRHRQRSLRLDAAYTDEDALRAHVKTRGPRGTTVKRRVPYEGDPGRLSPEARAYADETLGEAGIDSRGLRLVPTLTTRYLRTTLFLPGGGSRVTVDTGLTWALPDGTELRTPDRVIVETKAGRAGSGADRLLWSLGHRPVPVSKYGTGLAALRPDLPANRWLPVLRRHFPTAPALNGSHA